MLTANLITKSQKTVKAKGTEDSKNILKKNRSSLQNVKTTEKIFRTSFLMPREWYTNKLQEAMLVMTRRQDPRSIKASNLLRDSSKEPRNRNPLETMLAYKSESIIIFSTMIKWSSGRVSGTFLWSMSSLIKSKYNLQE